MGSLNWIGVGLVAGWLAKPFLRGSGFVFSVAIIPGVVEQPARRVKRSR